MALAAVAAHAGPKAPRAAGALLAGLTVYLLQRPPLAWRVAQQVLDQSTPEMREQITANVKDRLANLVQTQTEKQERIDPYGRFHNEFDNEKIADTPLDQFVELTLNNAELIAMVNEFFVDWTIQRGYVVPGGVNDPIVIARDGQLHMALMIQNPFWQQVFSGKVALNFKDDGMAIGQVQNLYAGSLPVSLPSPSGPSPSDPSGPSGLARSTP